MRLFVGVDLPVKLKQTLLGFQAELRQLGVDGFWKSQDNFHVTLEFLGELEPDRIAILSKILSKVASNYIPFELMIGGIGAFPSLKQPHTLWTAVSGSIAELNQLRIDLHHELKIEGFKLDERQFKPHITLASRPNLSNLNLSIVQAKKLNVFMVTEVVLFESRAIHGKRVYLDLYRAGFNIAGDE